ncbi:major facilitator superfamily permease [Streptomyces xiamenensis]|uniref:Major facilitator superfamily permease n=1 Tax=Streptomyces xiamenensis TaxID=408015 RepID=A0A0F7G0Q1_9ACTN|nr:MFS transporter [Streptomyces xiamenensis]AKG46755.1 major facilitator superfamily permease [Streptomyces xiamenensis]
MIPGTAGSRHLRPWHYIAAAYTFAVGMAGTTLPTPLYGLYQRQIGFSSFLVTVIFATYAVGVIAVLVLAGDLSDLRGRRPVLLIALLLSMAAAGCFLAEGGLPWLLAGRLLSGFSAGLLTGTATVTVMELAPPGGRERAAFAATAANMGGLGCGPLLAGVLAEYAPAPLRLPYLAHLGLLVVACALTAALPETARPDRPPPPLRIRPPGVPHQVRTAFVPAALAGFAGFAMFGLFTSVAPTFMATHLGVHNLAVSGAVVFSAFASSTAGQLTAGRLPGTRALPAGCFLLVAGMLLIGASLLTGELALLLAGAIVGGTGQGLAFRAGVTAVTTRAPRERRGETTSAFFVVAYLGISLPVLGVGALTLVIGLRDAGLVFTGCVTLLAVAIGLHLLRSPAAGPGSPGRP